MQLCFIASMLHVTACVAEFHETFQPCNSGWQGAVVTGSGITPHVHLGQSRECALDCRRTLRHALGREDEEKNAANKGKGNDTCGCDQQ